jgi:hypothetical protein
MNRFNLILQLRRATKKVKLLRKIIDFVPTFSRYDSYLYKYARVRLEEQRILRFLSSETESKLNLVCDLKCAPPSYGDFAEFLMAIRILSSRFEVTFTMVIDELRSDWKELNYSDQSKRINDFKTLAKLSLVNCRAGLKVVDSPFEIFDLRAGGQTVFADFVFKRKPIYWDLKILNKRLYQSLGCDPKVLLDQIEFLSSKSSPTFKYVLWHIRTGSLFTQEWDMLDEEIISSYFSLRKVLRSDIRIIACGNEKGLQRVMDLAVHHNLDITSARNYSDDFIGDLSLSSKSEFFLQVGPGGLAEYAWNRLSPYFVSSFPWKRREFKTFCKLQGSKNQITTWQTTNQVFFVKTDDSKVDLESELKEFCNNLGVGK